MAGWVLDTNVVSELARPRPDKRVVAFLEDSDDLWLSVITIHELEYGTEVADGRRQVTLRRWLDQLRAGFEGRVIDVDQAVCQRAAAFRAAEKRRGRVLSAFDGLIAATAAVTDTGLATRNTSDFETLGVRLLNPWS